jgi:hypothetical protein
VAQHRHKREPDTRLRSALTGSRVIRLAAGAAVAATLPAVGLGVLAADPAARAVVQADRQPSLAPAADRAAPPVSRSFDRTRRDRFQAGMTAEEATVRAVESADSRKWTTTELNLWSSAAGVARDVGQLSAGRRVLVTGRTADGRAELVVDGRSRWVTAGYLSSSKPQPAERSAAGTAAGLSMAPCPDPSVEYRLTPGAVYVYRSVCHAFPQITTYGGWDDHGEHVTGKALDIMTSDVSLGNAIAAFLQQHASELHIYDILWRQHIWTPVRASEGWRLFADRGSPTANHMDHVHVSVY